MVLSAIVYLGLGILDAFSEIILILKLYRLPAWRNRYKILAFIIGISLFSYLVRIVFNLSLLDLPFQYILFIIFFRYGLGIKIHLSSFIIGAGISLYTLIQLGIYYIGSYNGSWGSNILLLNEGHYVQIIQISSDIFVIIIALLFRCFNLGFSFVSEPPHDFLLKENYFTSNNLTLLFSSIISSVTIGITSFLLFTTNILGLTLIALFTFNLSYYFSKRRDYEDVRTAIETYSNHYK